MSESRIARIERWTVQYPDSTEERPVSVPHAWNQDVAVAEEGPAIYRTLVEVPPEGAFLLFHKVSYEAEVSVEGVPVETHRGLWDAFSIPLSKWAGRNVHVEVRVTKNGGTRFPVRDVASGFLPFVFNTFGGIYGDVELWPGHTDPIVQLESPSRAPQRVAVEGPRIFVEGRPFYIRGLLHWGWYPEVGHPNPPEATMRKEVLSAKALGFNLVKFCLWIPPHRYLEILAEEGMEAWIELPLWDPSPDETALAAMGAEMERIVRQYRRHRNVVVWTVGCELNTSTPADFRERLTASVKNLSGAMLVKDNSGGAEMYGGDLREFGDFNDFHPYCDTPFYPSVLDSLLPGPRVPMPTLLGEFNDLDVHRDLAKIQDETPYWASALPELNAQGVRWKHDLADVVRSSRFAEEPRVNRHGNLMEASRSQAVFVRKTVQEAVRSRDAIGGTVLTGWRDTPVTSSGVFDDWGNPRFSREEMGTWNGPTCLYLIPNRRPPWIRGGNRPGYLDSLNLFEGQVFWRVGIHSEHDVSGRGLWHIEDGGGTTVARGVLNDSSVPALTSREIGQIDWQDAKAGEYRLTVELGDAKNSWPVWIVPPPDLASAGSWEVYDPSGVLDGIDVAQGDGLITSRVPIDLRAQLRDGRNILLFMLDDGTIEVPFFREAAYEFHEALSAIVPLKDRWESLVAISPDRAIDPGWPELAGLEFETLINRIDIRTYRESPVLIRAKGEGTLIATTLRPFGGLGNQPVGVMRNAVGATLLEALMRAF